MSEDNWPSMGERYRDIGEVLDAVDTIDGVELEAEPTIDEEGEKTVLRPAIHIYHGNVGPTDQD